MSKFNKFSPALLCLCTIIALSLKAQAQTPTYLDQLGSSGSGNSQFDNPNGLAIDSEGNIYVADRNNERIQKFNSAGSFLAQWGSAGSGNGQFASNNGAVDIAIDPSGNVWVVDRGNFRVQKFSNTGTYLDQFGSSGSGNGQFDNPNSIAIDADGNIYIADRNNERIQKFNSAGEYQTQWGGAGSGDGQFASNNGAVDLAFDNDGNLWVADRGNSRAQKFSNTGTFLAKFGSAGTGNGQFSQINSIAIHPGTGEIYVADRNNERVQIFTSAGTYSDQFGSLGSGNGQFASNNGVVDLAFQPDGDLWLVDRGNKRIQKFDGPAVVVPPNSATVAATVFLEGAYNGSDLNTLLNASIPTAQPYSINGHSAGETAGSVPAGAVDWVLVELREAASASAALESTRVGSAAGFLMNDGTIKSTDGTSNLTVSLTGNSGADFFVVVYHRNHLPVMSADPISANGSDIYAIDFTTLSANTYQTTTALTTLSTGKFAMSAGDADGDRDVDAADLTAWRAQNGGAFTYNSTNGDFNLDGVINAVDRNDFQQKNDTKTSKVPTT